MSYMFKLILISICLAGFVLGGNEEDAVAEQLMETLLDPSTSFSAYPNIRQSRQNGMGALSGILGGGSSSNFFSSVFSGLTGMINKFSTSLGGPAVPSAMAKAFDGSGISNPLLTSQTKDAPLAGFKPPRMSRPGADVFRAMDARRKRVKGIHKRQISVKALKSFGNMNKKVAKPVEGPFGGELMQILQAVARMWSGMGGIGKTPVSRMKHQQDGFQEGAVALANRVSDLPNAMFGSFRSRRQTHVLEAGSNDDAEKNNEVKVTLNELAVAQQKNWFTYLRSLNDSTVECAEFEFCRTAKENNAFHTPAARGSGKVLSYLIAGLRDNRGKSGKRLSQAVDCCLSDDLVQAEACQDFYLQQCLEADQAYEPSSD